MKNPSLLLGLSLLLSWHAHASCGLLVTKSDPLPKPRSSQVLLMQDGPQITMSFTLGTDELPDDFVLIVPTPVTLEAHQMRLIDPVLFAALASYTAPVLSEAYDSPPCENSSETTVPSGVNETQYRPLITYENLINPARFASSPFDLHSLSSSESANIVDWLSNKGFVLPNDSEAILKEYIAHNLKFLLVTPRPQWRKKLAQGQFPAIQLSYVSHRTMLPIRLSLQENDRYQDLTVYTFNEGGRADCINYRSLEMPSNRELPEEIGPSFKDFYRAMFTRKWENEGRNTVLVEYADQVPTSIGNVIDDPNVESLSNEEEKLWLTRLKVRANTVHFPQDLFFQPTKNQRSFQTLFHVQHKATNITNCAAGLAYFEELRWRQEKRWQELLALTGWSKQNYELALNHIENQHGALSFGMGEKSNGPISVWWYIFCPILMAMGFLLMNWPLNSNSRRKARP